MRRFTLMMFVLAIFAGYVAAQTGVVASWTFPTGTASDSIATVASANNAGSYIRTSGGTSAIDFSKNGASTKAAQATGWDAGVNMKCWITEINTVGIDSIVLSSKITSGGTNPGPRDFKLQYRIDAGSWTDVAGGDFTVANNWTTGALSGIVFPEECWNKSSLFIRWIMTSDFDINGGALLSTGISKIDDIVINGSIPSGIKDLSAGKIMLYPNPVQDQLNIKFDNLSEINLEIYDISGKVVLQEETSSGRSVDMTTLITGLYFVQLKDMDGRVLDTQRLMKR